MRPRLGHKGHKNTLPLTCSGFGTAASEGVQRLRGRFVTAEQVDDIRGNVARGGSVRACVCGPSPCQRVDSSGPSGPGVHGRRSVIDRSVDGVAGSRMKGG